METKQIINWLRDRAKEADWSWRNVMLEAANRLEQHGDDKYGRWMPRVLLGKRVWECSECKTLGCPRWKRCPICEAKMYLPGVSDQTMEALEKMGRRAHGKE